MVQNLNQYSVEVRPFDGQDDESGDNLHYNPFDGIKNFEEVYFVYLRNPYPLEQTEWWKIEEIYDDNNIPSLVKLIFNHPFHRFSILCGTCKNSKPVKEIYKDDDDSTYNDYNSDNNNENEDIDNSNNNNNNNNMNNNDDNNNIINGKEFNENYVNFDNNKNTFFEEWDIEKYFTNDYRNFNEFADDFFN
jgi:hypothetical protein